MLQRAEPSGRWREPLRPVTLELKFGPVRLTARPPAVLWTGTGDSVVIRTNPMGFAGAPEADRVRWMNAFRRLLDGLDAPLQVAIDVEPGQGEEAHDASDNSVDLASARSADMSFVEQISRSTAAHRCAVSLVTDEAAAARLEPVLRE